MASPRDGSSNDDDDRQARERVWRRECKCSDAECETGRESSDVQWPWRWRAAVMGSCRCVAILTGLTSGTAQLSQPGGPASAHEEDRFDDRHNLTGANAWPLLHLPLHLLRRGRARRPVASRSDPGTCPTGTTSSEVRARAPRPRWRWHRR